MLWDAGDCVSSLSPQYWCIMNSHKTSVVSNKNHFLLMNLCRLASSADFVWAWSHDWVWAGC